MASQEKRSRRVSWVISPAIFLSVLLSAQVVFSAPAPLQNGDDSPVVRFAYKNGQSYIYEFSSTAITQIVGTSDEESRINVKGQVLLTAQASNEFVLTVKQVNIQTPSGKAVSEAAKLAGSSIKFTNVDGVLSCGISLEKDDPTWSANIKRALASLFTNYAYRQGQYPAQSYQELDVSGKDCVTYYTISGNKYIRKRDLSTCAKRDGGYLLSQGVPYSVDEPEAPKSDKSTIQSSQECTQEFDSGTLKSTECNEVYELVFFRNGDSGLKTTVKSTLNFVSLSNEKKSPAFDSSTESKIFFDFSDEDNSAASVRGANALNLLKGLCTEATPIITSPEITEKFLQLKREIQNTNEAGIKAAYDSIKSGAACSDESGKKKVLGLFLNSVATAGTSDSISFFSSLYPDESVANERLRRAFRLFLAFAAKPNDNALSAVLGLLKSSSVDDKLIVTAAGFGHQYCHNPANDCEKSSTYQDFVGVIANYASSNCQSKDIKSVEKAIAVLQGLGNLHSLNSVAEKAIQGCLEGGSLDRIKVNALQAFRRAPCDSDLHQSASNAFLNTQLPANVRIHAYIAVSKCLTIVDVNNINDILKDKKQSDQVQKFICSHVANILETASASRIKPSFQKIVEQINCDDSFSHKGIQRYSTNLESSHYEESYNTGYTAEANIIYSSDSFIPKTFSTNLTIDWAGRAYNLFEFGVNNADYEEYIASVFGPKGKRPQKFDTALSSYARNKRAAAGRSVAPTFDQAVIDSVANSVPYNKPTRETKGVSDIYVRVYGTTISTKSFTMEELRGFYLGLGQKKSVDWAELFLINKNIDELKQLPLYTDELLVPTISGLPLKIQVDGSAILSLKSESNFNQNDVSIDANTKVSGTVLGRARQVVGTGPIEAGLVNEFNWHGSHNAGLNIKVKRANENPDTGTIETRILLPEKQIRDWEISSKIFWTETKDYEIPTKKEVTSKWDKQGAQSGGFSFGVKELGLSTAINYNFAGTGEGSPKCPLNGANTITGYLQKSDESLKEIYILLDAKDDTSTKPDGAFGAKSFRFVFDTPGTKVNRKIEVTAKGNYQGRGNNEVEISVTSPFLNAKLLGNTKTVGTAADREFKATYNGKDYGLKVHTDLAEEEEQISALIKTKKATFEVSYTTPDASGTLLKGNAVSVDKYDGDKISGKLTLSGETSVQGRTSEASGEIEYESVKSGDSYSLTIKDLTAAHSSVGKFILNGKASGSKADQKIATDISLKYGVKTLNDLSFVFNADSSKPTGETAEAKLVSSRKPELNFDVTYERDFGPDSNKFQFNFNRASGSIAFGNEHKYTADGFKMSNDIKVTCQKSNTDFNLNTNLEKSGKKVNSDFTIKSGSNLNIVTKLNTDYGTHNYNFDSQGKAYGKDFTYTSSLVTTGSNKKHQFNLKVVDGFDVAGTSDFVQEDAKISLVSVITSDKFLTQPITFKQELYADGSFKAKGGIARNLKKSVTTILNGNDRTTSLVFEKTPPSGGKIEIYQANQIEATIETSFSKGVLVFDTDINIPSKQKRIVTKFEVKAAASGIDIYTQVKWDANNDPSKALAFKSSNTRNGPNIESKNSLDISGDKRELNIVTIMEPKIFNADHKVNVDYISGSKKYSVGLESRVDNSPNVKGGKTALSLDLPGQRPLKFNLDTKVSNLDLEKLFFDAELNYEGDISDEDTKDQFLNLKVGRQAVNSGRHFNLEANARIISDSPKGITIDADITKNSFKLQYKRSDNKKPVATVDIDVNRDFSGPLKSLSANVKVDTDLSSARPTFEGDVLYKYTFNSFKDFEVTETFSLGYEFTDSKFIATSGENYLKIGPNEFALTTSSKLQKEADPSPVTINDIEVRASSTDSKYNAAIDIRKLFIFPVEKSSSSSFTPKIQIELEPSLPNVKLSLVVDRAPVVNNFELKLSHEEAGKRSTNVNAKVGGQVIQLTSVLEFSKGKAATDFTFKLNNDAEKSLNLLVADSGSGPTAQASVKWGDGPNESITTKGNVVRSANGGFNADLVFDKTPLSSKWTLNVQRTVESDKKAKLEFNAESTETNQVLKFSLDRNIDLAAASSIKSTYEIAVTRYVSGKHAGSFALDFDRRSRQFTVEFEASKDSKVVDKSKIDIAFGDAEKRFSIESECDRPYCIDASATLKTSENSGLLEVILVSNNLKYGFEVDGSKSADLETLRVNTKLLFGQNNQQKEYAVVVYKEAGEASDIDLISSDISGAASSIKRVGIDATLGPRTISLVLALGKFNAPQAISVQENFWFDKSRKPAERYAWSVTKISKNDDNSRNYLLISKSPGIDKTFRIKTTRKLQQSGINQDIKLELDVYKRKEDAIVLSYVQSGPSFDDYSLDASVQSEGQGISFKKNCVVQSKGDNNCNVDCTASLKSPGEADSSYKFSASNSPQTASIKFQQLTPEVRNYYSTAEFAPSGCLKSLEYALPGFEAGETRYIQIEELDTPKGYNLKTYLKSEGDDYSELFVGQVVGQGLGLKLTRTEKGIHNNLLEIRRVENSTHLRSYEFLWNAENIKKSLSRIEAIQIQRAGTLSATLKARAGNISNRVKGIGESLKNARVDVDPYFNTAKSEISAIGSEIGVNTDKLVNKIEAVRAFVKARREAVPESLLAKSLTKIADLIASSKDTIPKLFATLRQRIDDLSNANNVNLEQLFGKKYVEFNRAMYGKLEKLNDDLQNVQVKNPNLNKAVNFLRNQLSSRYGDFLKTNEEDMYKLYPYPEVREFYQPFVSYLKQRIATPNKKSLAAEREPAFKKLDAAILAILRNALYTNFKGGQVVVNIPIYTQMTTLKKLLAVSRDHGGFSKLAYVFFKQFPKPGVGMIYGVEKYRTFDGEVGSFDGNCQYLLAADVDTKTFSVALDISKKGDTTEKSLYLSNGKNNAVILQDGTVFLDGKRSIGGQRAGNLETVREYGYVGVADSVNGVSIGCQLPGRWTNAENLNCLVRVSGYYFGRVQGLLGTFNSEDANDIDNAQQWKLNKQCSLESESLL